MNHLDQLITTLEADPLRMASLKAVRELNLSDCWIAAGFIRNFIWDQLTDPSLSPVKSDIDVIYFDPKDTRQKTEQSLTQQLKSILPDVETVLGEWSVKNQARMHFVNRDRPYQNCGDAMAHWPETVTAIAAKLNQQDEIELIAPFGLEDLYNKTVRPTPHFKEHKLFEFKVRQDKKKWKDRWRDLEFRF